MIYSDPINLRSLVRSALHIKATIGHYAAARYMMKRGASVELCHATVWNS